MNGGGGGGSSWWGERLRRAIVDSQATLPHRARPRIRSIAPRCHETSERERGHRAPVPSTRHHHNTTNAITLYYTIYIYNILVVLYIRTKRAHIPPFLYTMPDTTVVPIGYNSRSTYYNTRHYDSVRFILHNNIICRVGIILL